MKERKARAAKLIEETLPDLVRVTSDTMKSVMEDNNPPSAPYTKAVESIEVHF